MPAPIVFRTSCGGFRLDSSGRVTRLPRRSIAQRSGGTGRRYGADLQLRRNRAGRIFLLRRGRLVWRSSGLYPNDAGDYAFGPNTFAFAAYNRGVFLTDLKSPERLVAPGRGRFPYHFFASGRLILIGGSGIEVLSPEGRLERRYAYSRGGSLTFDGGRNTLFFVTPERRLAALRESHLDVGRPLRFGGEISFSNPGLLVFTGARYLAVTDRSGRLIAQARWAKRPPSVLDSGVSVSPDGRSFAFRLRDASPGLITDKSAVLYLLSAGERRARPVFRHRLARQTCGTGANLRWHGRHLLYDSSDGRLAIVDGESRARRDLSALAKALPRRSRGEQPLVAWAADYPSRSTGESSAPRP